MDASPGTRKLFETLGWVAVAILIGVGMISLIGRAFFLNDSFAQSPADVIASVNAFDIRYYEHPLATILHLIPGFLIMLVGPTQFIRGFRKRWLRVHRWAGRTFVACGVLGALTGLYIGALYPFTGLSAQGFNEAVATVFIAGYTLLCLYKAYTNIRARQIGAHREWMIRSWAIMLGIATERCLLGVLQVTTDISFANMFGTTFWLAAVINIGAAEFWIHLTRTSGSGARHWKDVDAAANTVTS